MFDNTDDRNTEHCIEGDISDGDGSVCVCVGIVRQLVSNL